MTESTVRPLISVRFALITLLVSVFSAIYVFEQSDPPYSSSYFILGILIFYSVFVVLSQWLAKPRELPGSLEEAECPFVSVVIPAHNEARVIARTVTQLLSLNYPRFDVWVFDDRSTDGTADVLKTLVDEHPNQFSVISRPSTATPGKSAVLNEALQCVPGEVLLTLDADGWVEPDFLKTAVPYLMDANVGAVQVQKRIQNAEANHLTRCQHHEYLLDVFIQMGRNVLGGGAELRGNGQLVKREALMSVNGWTEDTVTDDLDLSTKLHVKGWQIQFVTATEVKEEGITQWWALLKQRKRWAKGSIKRYLDYGWCIFTRKGVPFARGLDMLAYFVQFLLPMWMTMDVCFQLGQWCLGGHSSHLMSSLLMFLLLTLTFIASVFIALENQPLHRRLLWGVETGVYMVVVWFPVVVWSVIAMLCARPSSELKWEKTEHYGEA